MSKPALQLVQKLWNYCNMGSLAPTRSGLLHSDPQNPFRPHPSGSSLCDDGLSYGDYVEQLTFLLFRASNAAWGHAAYNTTCSVPGGRLPSTGVGRQPITCQP
jgi:hypothetical protein